MVKGSRSRAAEPPRSTELPDEHGDDLTLHFSFEFIDDAFGVRHLSHQQCASLCQALTERCCMQWSQVNQSYRHGLGSERIPVDQTKLHLPARFTDEAQLLALRYDGKLPLVGVRRGRVLYVLAIEAAFNTLYSHSKNSRRRFN